MRTHFDIFRFSALFLAVIGAAGCAASNDETEVGDSTSSLTTTSVTVAVAEAAAAGHVQTFRTKVLSPHVANTDLPSARGFPDAFRVTVHADPTPAAAAECLYYSAHVFVSASTGTVLDRARWAGAGMDLFTTSDWNCYPVDNGLGGGT
jgi:hypothetical protein